MSRSTRQRLVDAGFALFSREGFHAVGLDRILGEVGVSKQTFYNHFESKDDLVLEVLRKRDEWERDNLARMLREFGGTSPRRQLHALFDVLDAMFTEPEFRGCLFINAASEFPGAYDPAHQMAAEHMGLVTDDLALVAAAAGAEDPRGLAEELMMLVQGAITFRHVSGHAGAARMAKRMGHAVLARHLREREPACAVAADEDAAVAIAVN